MQRILVGILALAFLLPSLSYSQASTCVTVTKNLSFGSRGSEVTKLQQFLIAQRLLSADSATGFFGKGTQSAVQTYQKKNGIASSGYPATTGYGAVGKKTRAMIVASCTKTLGYTQSAYIPTIPTYAQSSYTSSYAQGTYYSEGAYTVPPSYSQGGYTVPPSHSQGTYYSQGNYYSQGGYYAQGSYVSAATLDDYWNGKANFKFVRKQTFPIDDAPGSTLGVGANTQQEVVVANGAWYRFSREFDGNDGAGCPGSGGLKIMIHKSTDKGATWTSRTTLVPVGGTTPWACQAADGSAYFDNDTTTWHYLFQCLGQSGVWNICHASRQNADPLGPFTIDPSPVIHGGDIYALMGLTSWHDEGTPQIVEKIAGKYYVTFHGYDGVRGIRAIAWTPDFHNWGVDTHTPIFGSSNCAGWNVSWTSSCIGSGWARVMNDGRYYNMVIEAADGNLACQQNQHWVFGLVRSTNLSSPSWQSPSLGPAIVFNTNQKYPNGTGVECGVQYADLFSDSGDVYLSVWRTGVANGNQDSDAVSGWYLYKLTLGAPVASYSFQIGETPNQYSQSDVVSRGDLEARLQNTAWLHPGLAMNGQNSLVTLPYAPVLNRTAPWTLEIGLTLNGELAAKSALIAGDVSGGAWIEQYPGGIICAWEVTSAGPKNACTPTALSFGTSHTLAYVARTNDISLIVDGVSVATTQVSSPANIAHISVGSLTTTPSNFYGSWNGALLRLSVYDYATQ